SALFIGMQRNGIPALIAIANKFAMAILVGGLVLNHWGLMAMAGAVALANLLSYCGALVAWRTWAAKVRIKWADASKQCAWQIGTYSGSLLIWMVGTLLVSGLDLTIVGIFDYRATAYYAIAATLTGLVTQVQGAIFATLLPATAVLGARGDSL